MPDANDPSREQPKGRGALGNCPNRYHAEHTERLDDGWHQEEPPPLRTSLGVDHARSAISWNDSPDIPFDRSINPYRGCEHGCIYCYARPSHAWLDLSPGLDFERRLFYKPDLPERLREALSAKSYKPAPMAIGSITDAYQPVEREQRLTRRVIEILCECRHPFTVITKSALIERDLDLIGDAAQMGIAQVAVSLTTLQPDLARRMEPRAATPQRRLAMIERLSAQGIQVRLMVAPILPVLTDHELETLMRAGRDAGASAACYVLLRLPREVSPLFRQWLREVAPDSFDHVMNRLREAHGDRDYDSQFGRRMTGTGVYANLLAQRFDLACRRLGLAHGAPDLRTDLFDAAALHGQLSLF
ncbi:PA0069 family radical SAM protein [Thiorhodococcus minor]|uniref:PA0069 family radical SAM protein n=1 Tax=Thiorhodococcus minor TaxID=57489 RepID=A0A6M0K574_9GAMM|nr:PA0069 family radical SAM protein [Thiorhodococcus minor]NEV64860.1 PA0069 family radical SAM protein [Thiorhodococcus minor]